MSGHADLHIHSHNSDGIFTPSMLVGFASDLGLKTIAISDHDSVSGIDEALEAGSHLGIEVIPAVELSVEVKGHQDVHLLGYFIDHRDPEFLERLEKFRIRRDRRGIEIIERINDKLIIEGKGGITYSEVIEIAGEALGRPHIARILLSKGYVNSMEEAFHNYLIPCNVPKMYFPANEALSEIKRIKGLAVLAHPTSISRDRTILRKVIADMAGNGLDGLEVYNNLCNADETDFLIALARHFGLAVTGGSDFHGNEPDDKLGMINDKFAMKYHLVEKLKERMSK